MKKTSLIVNIVLGVAVALLYILHFTSRPAKVEAVEGSESSVAVAGEVVYIDLDSLIIQFDMFHDLRTEFESKAQVVQNDLNKRGRALENDVKDFQTKVQKGLITRMQAENQQMQLAGREQELNEYAQQKQIELAEEEQVIMRRVMDALQTHIEMLNSDGRYSLILTTSGLPGTIMYGDDAINITSLVVEGMNDNYIKTKGK